MFKKAILLLASIGTLIVGILSFPLSQAWAQNSSALQLPQDNLNQQTLNFLNPLTNPKIGDPTLAPQFATPGALLSRILLFAFPIAGLILFVMITWGGFEILAGATDKKSLDSGKNRVTSALVGFLLLFASYWIVQVIQVVFAVKILG